MFWWPSNINSTCVRLVSAYTIVVKITLNANSTEQFSGNIYKYTWPLTPERFCNVHGFTMPRIVRGHNPYKNLSFIDKLLMMFHDWYLYCMDVISREWQERARFNLEHREEIETYLWKCGHAGKIIVETIDDQELQRLYQFMLREKNADSIKIIEFEMKDRALQKMWRPREKEDLNKLKEEVDIVELVRSYAGDFRYRPWALIKCPLPNHADWSPSFSMNPRRWLFKCFGCQKWWSQLDFIMEMEWCTIGHAIQKLKTYL